ncbi:NIL domain-containing protein [Pararobbsia alpina]|uniref:Uncharacterized protein n=1 Tax=Pararobbsia alpina TaxID=621374 RepID=A0A6S7BGE4_9BURK|nr:NIL domain-containing protein [Pararobbsia alpina]CAB3799559.1 hypothetical protein LMG28138_04675 [Pararobbsia alpina]
MRDLIANSHSRIGRQLLPIRPSLAPVAHHASLALEVYYGAQAAVRADWISLVGETLHARVSVHGGIIEDIRARTAGRLQISLAFHQGVHHDTATVIRYLESLGLAATVLHAVEPSPTAAFPAEFVSEAA